MKEFIVTNPYKLGAYFGHLLGKVYKKTPKKRLNTGEKVSGVMESSILGGQCYGYW